MNTVMLTSATVTKDTEARYNAEGAISVARTTVAVDRPYRKDRAEGEQTADFPSIVAFGKTAEFLEKYGKKGQRFDIRGRLQTGSYTKEDGSKVYTTDVVVEQIEFSKGNPKENGGTSSSAPTSAPADTAVDDFMNIPDGIDETLPFK